MYQFILLLKLFYSIHKRLFAIILANLFSLATETSQKHLLLTDCLMVEDKTNMKTQFISNIEPSVFYFFTSFRYWDCANMWKQATFIHY